MKAVTKTFSTVMEDGELEVVIRQARVGDNLRRGEYFAEVTQIYDDAFMGPMQVKQSRNAHEIRRFEVFATLVGCNLQDEDGEDLFRFGNNDQGAFLDMTEPAFNNVWDLLPMNVAELVHDRVLEVNVLWDPTSGDED